MDQTILGILIVLVGGILLIENIGPDIGLGNLTFDRLWPVILIVYGVASMVRSYKKGGSDMWWGGLITLVGIGFFTDRVFDLNLWDTFGNAIGDFWPVVLIVFGGYLLLRERR